MKYRIFQLSENSLTIDFGNIISAAITDDVVRLADKIIKDNPGWLIEIVPAYSSLTIFYDVVQVRKKVPNFSLASDAVKNYLERIIKNTDKVSFELSTVIQIPVCYDQEFASDLENISKAKRLGIDDIISIHSSTVYRVFMLGFLPGFAYMGEVDKRIAVPRLETPRTKVAKGSIGIAGSQTGIYPLDSPGGWQIIGRTPLDLFRPHEENLTLLKAGDFVEFYPINKSEFQRIAK